jgi:hypothetical protein
MDHDTIDTQVGAAPPSATATASGGGSALADLMPAFLAELARAMQAAAQRERTRIAKVVADEAADHVDRTRTRAAAENEELRRLAEADVERIQAWSAAEVERIRGEAERRTAERRSDLEAYMARHESIIATEVEGVDAAVRDYDATLTLFFDELAAMTDPADIARRAGSLPPLPDLDAVRAAARAGAVAQYANPDAPNDPADPVASGPAADGASGVAVMDPDAVGRSDEASSAPEEKVEEAPAAESTAAPPADPLHVPADENADFGVSGPPEQPSAAIRVLRTIAPWTASGGQDAPDGGATH